MVDDVYPYVMSLSTGWRDVDEAGEGEGVWRGDGGDSGVGGEDASESAHQHDLNQNHLLRQRDLAAKQIN